MRKGVRKALRKALAPVTDEELEMIVKIAKGCLSENSRKYQMKWFNAMLSVRRLRMTGCGAVSVKMARPKKNAVLMYLNERKQNDWDTEHWVDCPDVVGEVLGNKFRCLTCGAPPGKQCIKADGSFRNYPHQKRRDVALLMRGTTNEGQPDSNM